MRNNLEIVFGVFGFLVLLGVLSFIFNSPTGDSIKNEGLAEGAGPLAILNYELTQSEDGSLSVTGLAENTAGKQLSYAEIIVKFYDIEGDLIESSFDSIDGLDSGEKWNFEVMYLGPYNDQVYGYEVSVGSIL